MTSQFNSSRHSIQTASCWGDGHQAGPALQEWGLPDMDEGQTGWALAWSDLMMVLFVLFCVLFVYALNNQQTRVEFQTASYALDSAHGFGDRGSPFYRAKVDQSGSTSMESLYAHIAEAFSALPDDRVSIGYARANHVTVRLQNKALFEPGRSTLAPGSAAILDRMARVLGMVGNDVQVAGHVNTRVEKLSRGQNVWQLSAERAGNVVGYFVRQHGFSPERFVVQAFGNTAPLVPGLNTRNQAANNRVEIRVMAPRLGLDERTR